MRCTVLRRLCRKMGLAVETVPHAAHAGQVAGLGGLVFELLPTVREVFISITCLAIVSLLYSRGRVRDGNDWCAARGGNLNRTEAAGTSDLTVVAGTRQSSSYFQCPQTSFLPRRHDSLVQSAASVTTPGRPTDRSDDRFPATGPWPGTGRYTTGLLRRSDLITPLGNVTMSAAERPKREISNQIRIKETRLAIS